MRSLYIFSSSWLCAVCVSHKIVYNIQTNTGEWPKRNYALKPKIIIFVLCDVSKRVCGYNVHRVIFFLSLSVATDCVRLLTHLTFRKAKQMKVKTCEISNFPRLRKKIGPFFCVFNRNLFLCLLGECFTTQSRSATHFPHSPGPLSWKIFCTS